MIGTEAGTTGTAEPEGGTWPGSGETSYGQWLAIAALVLLFVTVFFSVFLQEMASALGWLSFIVALIERRPAGTGPRWRDQRALLVPMGLFLVVSAVTAAAGEAPAAGWRVIRREVLDLGCLLAGAAVVRLPAVRFAVAAFLSMAAVAGAWSIVQVVVDFGGEFSYHRRTHGFWHRDAFISYGYVMAMAFALVLGIWFWGASRLRRLGLLTAVMALVGMITSYTRASWLAASAVFGLVAVWRRAVVPLVALVVFAGVVLATPSDDYLTNLIGRARSSFDLDAPTNIDRVVRYRVGLAVIRDHPWLGVGAGELEAIYPRYALPGAMDNWHLHNTYLQILAERGPLGLAAWLYVMVWTIVHAVRAGRGRDGERAALSIGVALLLVSVLLEGVLNYVWDDWRIRSLTLAFLGLAWSPALGEHAGPSQVDRHR